MKKCCGKHLSLSYKKYAINFHNNIFCNDLDRGLKKNSEPFSFIIHTLFDFQKMCQRILMPPLKLAFQRKMGQKERQKDERRERRKEGRSRITLY